MSFGEDQPDRRLVVLRDWISTRLKPTAWFGELLDALDRADRAAGIRRVTEQFTQQQMWAAWDDGYEAARTGQQPHNPYRSKDGA